ncbi:MAG: LCP family protein [Peptococcaceae bacterium]|nr:LCP family protein [Peptococcaceae bacterium]
MMSQKRLDAFRSFLIIVGVTMLGVGFGSELGLALHRFAPLAANVPVPESSYTASDAVDESEQITKRVTFLLIGTDQRPEDKHYRTDSLILASADPETKIISLLSIPRDSMVLGNIKINAIPFYYGYDMVKLVSVVSDITGVKIDGYVKTNFDGFKDIVDTLGGVDIYIETDMRKNLGGADNINLVKGMQHLDGDKALQYARYREYVQGDIHRTACQQKLLMAIAQKALQAETILKMPQLIPQVNNAVETDLKLSDLLKLAGMAKNFRSENMVSATLPGVFYTAADGQSFWRIDETVAKKVTANLFKGITSNKVVSGPSVDFRPKMEPEPMDPKSEEPNPQKPKPGTDTSKTMGEEGKPSNSNTDKTEKETDKPDANQIEMKIENVIER